MTLFCAPISALGDNKAVLTDENAEKNKKQKITHAEGAQMVIRNNITSASSAGNGEPRKGMVLPFKPLSLAFNHVNYYVDMPAVSLHISPKSHIVSSVQHAIRILGLRKCMLSLVLSVANLRN